MSSPDRAAELAVVAGRPFFSSWSGGKDSYLALQRAVAGGGRPVALLTMLDEGGRRTHSHALPVSLVARQAQALGLPLVLRSASWDTYEAAFIDGLAELRGERGVEVGVFGDIGFTAPPIGHSHPLVCGLCRRVVRFDGDGDLTTLEARLAAETGFAIYGHHLEVYGVCAECRGVAR